MKPLPIALSSSEMFTFLSEADRALGGLRGSGPTYASPLGDLITVPSI